jgi:hypothetical protein
MWLRILKGYYTGGMGTPPSVVVATPIAAGPVSSATPFMSISPLTLGGCSYPHDAVRGWNLACLWRIWKDHAWWNPANQIETKAPKKGSFFLVSLSWAKVVHICWFLSMLFSLPKSDFLTSIWIRAMLLFFQHGSSRLQ